MLFLLWQSYWKCNSLSSQPHGLLVGDVINVSGLSTDTLRRLDGQHRIGFNIKIPLNVGLETTGATGIVTSIDITGDLSARNINANDVLGISTERMLVLNVDNVNGKVRVQREFDGVLARNIVLEMLSLLWIEQLDLILE